MNKDSRNIRKTVYGSEVEYFDGNKWRNISDYKRGDKVLTFFIEDKHVELLEPLQYIRINKGRKNLINLQVRGLNFSINHEAIFPGDYRNGQSEKRGVRDIKTIFTLEQAIDSNFMLFTHINMYASFKYDSKFSSMLNESKLKMMIIGIMLGQFKDKECEINNVDNELKNHIRSYLKTGGMKFNILKNGEKYNIKFTLPRSKKLFIENPLMFSNEEINMLIDEIEYLSNNKIKLYPKNKDCYDFVQMIYALGGKRVEIKNDCLYRENKGYFIPERNAKVKSSNEIIQYSFSTRSGYIVLRNNGRIFVMGDYKK